MKANELMIGNWVSYITAEGAEIEYQRLINLINKIT